VSLDDDPDEPARSGPPPPPDDRLWRHPSELGGVGGGTPRVRFVMVPPSRKRIAAIGVLSALLGAALAVTALAATGSLDRQHGTVAVEQVPLPHPTLTTSKLRDTTRRALPAIARINVTTASGSQSGTAILFRNDGHLLTTADVVSGAIGLSVQLYDGSSLPAQLVGSDPISDVAVIKIDRTKTPTAVLGRQSDVELGEPAITVDCVAGQPRTPSIGYGLVSAVGRRYDPGVGSTLVDMIMTNVHVADTSTSAALVDASGAVIGLITNRAALHRPAVATTTTHDPDALAASYATPIDYAEQVADEIITTGHAAHAWLGVDTSDGQANQSGSSSDAERSGARIDTVYDNSPAKSAGLHDGDLLVGLDDTAITSSAALALALRQHDPYERVDITYLRDGAEHEAHATLGDR
jgi:S1-C subfamily serine protease